MSSSTSRFSAAVSIALAALLMGACSPGGGAPATSQVRAILSSEDASDILPGSRGDFVVMIHLQPDGATTPLVMLTPRTATTYAPYLVTDDSIYLMDVPEGAAWPLTDTALMWDKAIISSESQLQATLLTQTAEQLPIAAIVESAVVDSSIKEWTQQNVSHMAGAYLIDGEKCIPGVVRQATPTQWLLTAVPGWNDPDQLAALAAEADPLVISDSTRVNPSRIASCAPGGTS